MRPHQWVKNLLVFVPLALAHQFGSDSFRAQLTDVGWGFVAFCCIASAIYLFNDLLDVEADRIHPTKKKRPIASGELSPSLALGVAVALVAIGGGLATFLLPLKFAYMLGLYLVTTIAYSIGMKRIALLDVFTLAGLYTLRLLAGGAAAQVDVSQWLMAFSMFIFSSLAFVKRYAEIGRVIQEGKAWVTRRGYETEDVSLIQNMGLVCGYLAVLVLALYINSSDVQEIYPKPRFLWLMCPLMMYWISRVWMLARRNKLGEDPVVIASTDPVSWAVGVLSVLLVLLARS